MVDTTYRPIPALEYLHDSLTTRLSEIFDRLERGEITVAEWETLSSEAIASHQIASYMAGIGSDELDEQAQKRIKAATDKQDSYLAKFAGLMTKTVVAGTMWGLMGDTAREEPRWRAWRSRARSYAGSVREVFWQGFADGFGTVPPGMIRGTPIISTPIGDFEAPAGANYFPVGGADTPSGAPPHGTAAGGWLLPSDYKLPFPAMPADGTTQCLTHCRCGWVVDELDKAKGDFDCYWVMDATAEHCQTCVERARRWNPLKVRDWQITMPDLWKEATTLDPVSAESELPDDDSLTGSLKGAIIRRLKGGPGSGNFGHVGRPGKVGGSAPDGYRPPKHKIGRLRVFDDYDSMMSAVQPAPSVETWCPGSWEMRFVVGPDGKFYCGGKNRKLFHTQIMARIALAHPDQFDEYELELAQEVVKDDAIENYTLETMVADRMQLISCGVYFSGTKSSPYTEPNSYYFKAKYALPGGGSAIEAANYTLKRVQRLIKSGKLPAKFLTYSFVVGVTGGHTVANIPGNMIEDAIRFESTGDDNANVRYKGGPGSGNFGHSGRPGKVGGSARSEVMVGGVLQKFDYADAADEFTRFYRANDQDDSAWTHSMYLSPNGDFIDDGETHEAFAYLFLRHYAKAMALNGNVTGIMVARAGFIRLISDSGNDWLGIEVSHRGITDKQLSRLRRISRKITFSFDVDDEDGKNIGTGYGIEDLVAQLSSTVKGGPGSGNFGHSGRPGKVGGSAPSESMSAGRTEAESSMDAALLEIVGYTSASDLDALKTAIAPRRRPGSDKPQLYRDADEVRFVATPDGQLHTIADPDRHYHTQIYAAMVLENKDGEYTDEQVRSARWLVQDGMVELTSFETQIQRRSGAISLRSYRDLRGRARLEAKVGVDGDDALPAPERYRLEVEKVNAALRLVQRLVKRGAIPDCSFYDFEGFQNYFVEGSEIDNVAGFHADDPPGTWSIRTKGGKGSGNFGHAGRPGEVGGSAPAKGGVSAETANFVYGLSGYNDKLKVIGSGTEIEASQETLDKLATLVEALPKGAMESFNQFILSTTSRDFVDAYLAMMKRDGIDPGEFGRMMAEHNIGGIYDPVTQNIYLRTNFLTEHVVHHEVAHGIAHKNRALYIQHWESEYKRDGSFDRFTDYSYTSPDEGFAESFVSYTATRGIANSPEVKRVFDAVENILAGALHTSVSDLFERVKGGPGSGFYGHAGRPGKVGGSSSRPGVSAGLDKKVVVSDQDYTADVEAAMGRVIGSIQPVIHANPLATIKRLTFSADRFEYRQRYIEAMVNDYIRAFPEDRENIIAWYTDPDLRRRELHYKYGKLKDRWEIQSDGSQGFFTQGEGGPEIVVAPLGEYYGSDKGTERLDEILTHEFGHAIQSASIRGNAWGQAYHSNPKFDRRTVYAHTNQREGFAETFVAFIASKGYDYSGYLLTEYSVVYDVIHGVGESIDERGEWAGSLHFKGGPGSGFYGHAGRPGKRGGSAPSHSGAMANPRFRRWFGESVVTDDDGNPLVVYHGTKRSFSDFSPDMRGAFTGARSAQMGFFFTDSADVAATYSDYADSNEARVFGPLYDGYQNVVDELADREENDRVYAEYDEEQGGWLAKIETSDMWGQRYDDGDGYVYDSESEAQDAAQAYEDKELEKLRQRAEERRVRLQAKIDEQKVGSNIMPVYLRIENPYEHDFHGGDYRDAPFSEIIERAISEGNDGVIFWNVADAIGSDEVSNVYIVFKPTQIKSVYNQGGYSRRNPRIDMGVTKKGGRGSGNFGHSGRPGKVGGSAPADGVGGGMNEAHYGGRPLDESAKPYLDKLLAFARQYREDTITSEAEDDRLLGFEGLEDERINGVLSEGLYHYRTGNQQWSNATDGERGRVKAEIVRRIAERTSTDPEIVDRIIGQWAATSNGWDIRSLSLQEAISEEFSVELSQWQRDKMERAKEMAEMRQAVARDAFEKAVKIATTRTEITGQSDSELANLIETAYGSGPDYRKYRLDKIREVLGAFSGGDKKKIARHQREFEDWVVKDDEKPITTRDVERRVVRAMYEITQADFLARGFLPNDEITVFRGFGVSSAEESEFWFDMDKIGQTVRYRGNAAESWTVGAQMGASFGDIHIATRVKVKDVLSTCRTGFGCLTEGEVVVIGNSDIRATLYFSLWYPIKTTNKGGEGSGNHNHAGRPGKRGGSAPRKGAVPSKEEKIKTRLKTFEDSIRGDARESALVILADESEMVFHQQGDETTISLPEMDYSDAILSHNHPSGGSFSDQDVQFMLCENLREMRACTVNGVFVVKRPPGGQWGSAYLLLNAEQNRHREMQVFFDQQSPERQEQLQKTYWDDLWSVVFNNLGWEYHFEALNG